MCVCAVGLLCQPRALEHSGVLAGRQLTIFNSQSTIKIGGWEKGSRPFQGQLSGLYYNGLKVLNMAAEADSNVRLDGSARLVGDMPSSSITPQSSASASGNRSHTPSLSDITTTTAANRQGKQTTTTPQVSEPLEGCLGYACRGSLITVSPFSWIRQAWRVVLPLWQSSKT